MFDIKECRKIKRDYTKNNLENKKIFINVENYPSCYMIITHGNGKSWGYFFNANERLFLGQANQKTYYANLRIKEYSIFNSDYKIELAGGNEAIKNAYSEFIVWMNRNWHWNKNLHFTSELQRLFRINPFLFANLTDCDVFKGVSYNCTTFYNFNKIGTYAKDFDYTKPLIKDACKMPAKWVVVLFNYQNSVERINLFRKYNYTVDEAKTILSICYCSIPLEIIKNKEATFAYAKDHTYRDYYHMYMGVSPKVKAEFPILPKDIEKYHNKLVPIYNREQAYRKKKEIEDKQNAYKDNVYEKASKFNYSNNEYLIKACEELIDLLIEGSSLHHCVGSYVNSVSEGKEYILFLRKVSEPDTPYFTIDLTPNHQVRQIHGMCNCNMTDDIKPFVDEWAKKFKLNLEGCSGVRCALH